jgi:hypothetical protein
MEFVSFENLLYDFPPNELGNQFIGIMGPLLLHFLTQQVFKFLRWFSTTMCKNLLNSSVQAGISFQDIVF